MAYIEISKRNLFFNLELIKNRLGSIDKISVCLKDNAYGHGIVLMAVLCSEYGVQKAIVRNMEEAYIIEKYFNEIIVLMDIPNKKISSKISIVVNDLDSIKDIDDGTNIHLKIDTGMHRNGILSSQIKEAFLLIQEKNLILKGVMTHYSSADEINANLFTQFDVFRKCKNEIINLCKESNTKTPLFHSENSSAVFRLNTHDDFARVGLSIYGYIVLDENIPKPKLKPILRLYATKISSRELNVNHKIGYNQEGKLDKKSIISTYDIGYGNGFFRLNNDEAYYTKDNERIIGKVSMSNISINSNKKEVCLIYDVDKLANIKNTIPYDILVKLSFDIKRIIT